MSPFTPPWRSLRNWCARAPPSPSSRCRRGSRLSRRSSRAAWPFSSASWCSVSAGRGECGPRWVSAARGECGPRWVRPGVSAARGECGPRWVRPSVSACRDTIIWHCECLCVLSVWSTPCQPLLTWSSLPPVWFSLQTLRVSDQSVHNIITGYSFFFIKSLNWAILKSPLYILDILWKEELKNFCSRENFEHLVECISDSAPESLCVFLCRWRWEQGVGWGLKWQSIQLSDQSSILSLVPIRPPRKILLS